MQCAANWVAEILAHHSTYFLGKIIVIEQYLLHSRKGAILVQLKIKSKDPLFGSRLMLYQQNLPLLVLVPWL